MNTVAIAWEEHLRMLKESEAPETIIRWCQNSFEAGAESYLLPGVTTKQCWEQFHRHVLLRVCRQQKVPGKVRDILIAECKEAFEAGAEAQWMQTATDEELRAKRDYYVKQLRRELQ